MSSMERIFPHFWVYAPSEVAGQAWQYRYGYGFIQKESIGVSSATNVLASGESIALKTTLDKMDEFETLQFSYHL